MEATQNQCWLGLSYKQIKTSQHKKGVEQISVNPSGAWDHEQRGSDAKAHSTESVSKFNAASGKMSNQHYLNYLLSSLVQVT